MKHHIQNTHKYTHTDLIVVSTKEASVEHRRHSVTLSAVWERLSNQAVEMRSSEATPHLVSTSDGDSVS